MGYTGEDVDEGQGEEEYNYDDDVDGGGVVGDVAPRGRTITDAELARIQAQTGVELTPIATVKHEEPAAG